MERSVRERYPFPKAQIVIHQGEALKPDTITYATVYLQTTASCMPSKRPYKQLTETGADTYTQLMV